MAQLIKTPHPVTLEGQEHIAVHLVPGESLFALLNRTLGDQLDNERWNVSVNGVEVPVEEWHSHHPKHGAVIECVGDMGRSALMMIAVVALTIWTGGAFAAVAAGGSALGLSGVAGYAAIMAVQVAGSLLINKVLGPKPPGSPDTTQGPTAYSLNNTQNQPRQHGAPGLLFGKLRFAPDLLSQTYNYFDRDDMYMAMHLAWGIGVGRVEGLRNGDTLLSDYDDAVTEYSAGFTKMPNTGIPLFGNTDSIPGGALQQEKVPMTQVRTTSVNTVRVLVNLSGSLFGVTRKGKLSMNQESFEVSYRRVGATGWEKTMVRPIQNDDRRTLRFTIAFDVPEGQYDVQVRRLGRQSTGDGDTCEFSWDTLVSVQKDTSDYRGIARTGFTLRANERLASQPTAVNGFAVSYPLPVWTGSAWVEEETSNPGAQMLKYLRGYFDAQGNLIAGMGLEDEDIDVPAFQAFMVHCRDNGHTYDFWLNQDRDHLEVLNNIARAGMGQFTDANGLMSISWVAEEQPIDGTVNMARIKKGTFRVDYSLVATADGVEVRYWDGELNKEALLRIPMPGVTTMLNPAKLSLEGVTTEDQAALMGRYHLAQSLYQFKDVSFGTGLENLTYRRLSLLQMQHDLTQWGYGGVVVKAEQAGNRIRLTLDEAVPAPPTGRTAYIGVRVPGQRAAAIFKLQPFSGETKVVTLDEAWPADLALPGDTTGNPAHDSIWIYDFKETPGLTVRVVNISRAADRSANVSVVAESQEFWTYVRTGFYEPAESGSLLQTRPVVSALTVVDQQVVIGDVIQDQLVVSFDVSGPYEESIIYTTESDGSLRERARTRSRSAEFNIPGPGTYTVTVVPLNRQGLQGKPVSVQYTTVTAGLPPVLVDTFDVEDAPGGIRRYVWGFLPQTLQSPDFAGVEIRYVSGVQTAPLWEMMLPVGEGFFVSSQELVLPPSGTWTFACRSRNTSGVLSEGMRVVSKMLKANTAEVISGIEQGQGETQRELEKEINDRINADLENAQQARDELAQKSAELQGLIEENAQQINDTADALAETATGLRDTTDKLAQEVLDRVNGDLNTRLDLTSQITQETQQRESDVENLTRQLTSIAAGSGEQFERQAIWYFDTNGNLEGWTGVYGTPTVVDGFLRPANNAAGQNTGVQSPVIALDGNAYRYLKMRVKWQGSPQWLGLVRWITDADRSWDAAKSVTLPQPSVGASGVGVVDLSDIPWNGASPVRAIRLALTNRQTATDNIAFDWIAIGRPAPGASMADIREEAQARIAADTAEATARSSLAVQMRGDYTGTDPAGLTSGIVANERDARINGDSVNAQAIQVVQARLPAGSGKLATEASVTSLQQATTAADNALGQRIDTINVNLDSKADVSLVNALRGDVNRIDNTVTAQAAQITQLDISLNAAQSQGKNLIRNGSIEVVRQSGAPEAWNLGSGWSRNATEGVNGGACLRRDANAATGGTSASANLGTAVWVEAGKTYRYSCRYRTTADFNGSTGNSKLRLGNQDGGLIPGNANFLPGKDAWTYVEAFATISATGNVKGLKLTVVSDNTVGTLWVDEVALEEVTEQVATSTALQTLTTDVNQLKDGSSASAAAITKLQSQIVAVGGDNLLTDSSFEQSNTNASVLPNWASSSSGSVTFSYAASDLPGSTRSLTVASTLATASAYAGVEPATTLRPKVVVGKPYVQSVWASGTPGSSLRALVQFVNAAGSAVGTTTQQDFVLTDTMQRFVRDPVVAPTGAVRARVIYRVVPGNNTLGANTITLDNAQFQQGQVATEYSPSVQQATDTAITAATAVQGLTTDVSSIKGTVDAQATLLTQLRTDVNDVTSKTNANTTAVQQLTTRTTAVEGKVDTLGTQVTTLNNSVQGSFNRGDNLNTNPTFDGSIDPFVKGNANAVNGDVTWVLGGGQQGSAIQMVHKVGASGSPFVYANSGRWVPLAAGTGRRLRAVVVARALSGTATLTHRFRVRSASGESNSDQTTATLTTSWVRYTLETNVGDDRQETMSQLWVTNRDTANGDAVVLVDRIELYDITNEVAINANASATQGLATRVTAAEGKIETSATAVTELQAGINSIGGDNLLPNSSYEESTATNVAPTGYVTEGTMTSLAASYVTSPLSGGGRAFRLSATATAVGQYIGLAASNVFADKVVARPNTDYTLSTYARGTAGAILRMYVQFVNASNTVVATVTMPDVVCTAEWQRVVVAARTTNTTAVAARVFVGRLHATATGAHALELDNAQFQEGKVATQWRPSGRNADTALAANATAISGLTTTVNQQGTKLDATAQSVTNLQAQIGSVSATGFNNLQTQVNQQGTKIDAQAQQISGVQASLSDKADAAVVQTMDVRISDNLAGGGNLLANASFQDALVGWALTDGTGSSYRATGASDPGLPSNVAGVIIVQGSGTGVTRRAATPIPVQEGKGYMVSTYVSGQGGAMQLDFFNAAGAYLGGDITPTATAGGGQNIANSARPYKVMYAPDGAVIARPWLVGPTGNGNFGRFFRPMVEEARVGQVNPSPWAAGGLESSASWSVNVRADGRVAGVRLGIEGGVSAFDVVADMFRVSSPGNGGRRTEYSDGHWRVYRDNGSMILRMGTWN